MKILLLIPYGGGCTRENKGRSKQFVGGGEVLCGENLRIIRLQILSAVFPNFFPHLSKFVVIYMHNVGKV